MVDRSVGRTRAAVVGTGLIGGSLLLGLRAAGLDVAGWDPDPTTRAQAREQGATSPDRLDDAVADRDVVFLCGPLPTLPETLLRVAALTGDGCVLTDVGSTKAELAGFADGHGLAHRFVPGHPMAGTDRAGLTAAVPGLFETAAWVLCPTGPGLPAFRWLAGLLLAAFRSRVVPMSASGHDAVVALSSHVPHLLAGALAGAVHRAELGDAVLALAAGSFRDGTRVAGSPPQRTANMLLGNREQVLRQLDGVRAYLDELAGALRADDPAGLVGLYRGAATARTGLDGRTLRAAARDFPLRDTGDAELAYLLALGADGGHLSGCRVADGRVTYTAHLPTAVL
ncbi:prephenate dehydrogenase [Micromonospora rosaria]|uniref:Prephenate dehydrogenase n=1 Tax=Micromonospora rosaria TaxID=47874 RepID=A0A136PXU2_9ACTN|nr:prephenate dehydrogenase/arogenate dehydrogenase family protein [Micromonospora rosaria]KXK63298.1 prephenate dehydrogenase [Micromonospora rosaria]